MSEISSKYSNNVLKSDLYEVFSDSSCSYLDIDNDFEAPNYIFKITDFTTNENSSDNDNEEKQYFELKPAEILLSTITVEDEFQIEEIISEKSVLDYDHEIETSSYEWGWSYPDDNSCDDNWDYFETEKEVELLEEVEEVLVEDTILAPYQCSSCSETFHSSNDLCHHLQDCQRHDWYKCVICDEEFETPSDISNHMKEHKDVKRPYACLECGKKFKTFEYLENHRQNRMCNQSHNICAVCGKEFKNQFNLVRHRTVHTNERPYKCAICGKKFKQQDNLNVHVRCHQSDRPYKCDKCPKTFKDQSYLIRHRKLHVTDFMFRCSVCEKPFRLLVHLQKHMRIHSSKRQHKCPHCNKSFRKLEQLSAHFLVHTDERKYICHICNDEFTNSGYLIRHMTTHKTVDNLKCDYCDLKFDFPELLKKHRLTHDGIVDINNEKRKTYKCTICYKHFINPDDLLRHITKHTEDRPFKCNVCSKCFKTIGYLKKHERQFHTNTNNELTLNNICDDNNQNLVDNNYDEINGRLD